MTSTVLIVTLGKSETYKETIKEKSTILPYSIHKRIHRERIHKYSTRTVRASRRRDVSGYNQLQFTFFT